MCEESSFSFRRLKHGDSSALSSSLSSRTMERFRGEEPRVPEVPKRIGRDDGDDLKVGRPKSELALFVDGMKLSFWTMPYAILN